ncbi:MAG: DUF6458 family protein [Solirubrobacterales bacterium]
MTIGGSIFTIVIGAILKFALDVDLAGIALDVVGVILMIAGALGLVIGLALSMSGGDAGRRY